MNIRNMAKGEKSILSSARKALFRLIIMSGVNKEYRNGKASRVEHLARFDTYYSDCLQSVRTRIRIR
jgi:hypothetical protein